MANEQENEAESLPVKKNKQKSDLLHLWVNLKIPKQEQQQEERGADIIIEDDQTIGCKNNTTARVCSICQATFGSGKALGGHMRVHFRRAAAAANKKQNPKLQPPTTTTFKKEKKKKIASDQNQKLPVKKPTCSLCGRGFLSMKSLFGHMRSHPNREWRGIHPPSNASVDLTGSLSGWAVTARRGRQAASTASSSEVSTSDEDHQLHQAAACLMMLSQSGGEKPETAKNHVFEKEVVEEEEARTKRKRKKVKLCDLVPPLMDDDDKKKVAVAAAVVVDKYKCSSCERSFTTHQALGGHMSSHNRSNHNNNINLIINNNNNNISMLAKNEDLVCNDYPYPQVVEEETTNKGGGLSSNVVMEFDLNEAPPPSDDGEFCSSW
ncbi:hypothetical protein ABFS82_13G151600 [Erythranthe guttata]|nr:PREDICTED: zinc finger protein ZAT1-like [Erythranthe guttata]|eukprot:XP_012848636.1 PREDICTED: zinc finger protein ZAT1-like [Erythranthe guttata]